MENASVAFIAFGLAVALLSNLSRSPAWRFAVLLGGSAAFLALLRPAPAALLPFVAFLLLGYLGVAAQRRGLAAARVPAILLVILAFAWLKRYTVFPAEALLPFPYLTLGLSYVFFRVLHLVIDAGAPGPARAIPPLPYLGYTLNFTTFVSGPIQRYENFAEDQFAPAPPPLDAGIVATQLARIVRGFFKVNVLALLFSMVQADAVAALAQPVPTLARLLAALRLLAVYPFFLYCNFSGYIDVVIALARLMRLRLPENFDRPFSATSFLDFWSRWHITLSGWLKTYVYNPLLLALMERNSAPRVDPYLAVACFFVTFFLVGIWHGRTSEFALFGVLQGGGVAANKLWQVVLTRRLGRKRYQALAARPFYAAAAHGLTFTWFAVTLFWFWASWGEIDAIAASVGGWWAAVVAACWAIATVALAAWEAVRARLLAVAIAGHPVFAGRYAQTVYATVMAAIAFLFTAILAQPAPEIVYKTF